MKKILKVSLILATVLSVFANLSVFAVETTNENTNSANTSNTSTTNTSNTSQNNLQSNTDTSNETVTQVSSVSSVNEGELQVSDIINILLIATGVVIIFLAIAIIVKFK